MCTMVNTCLRLHQISVLFFFFYSQTTKNTFCVTLAEQPVQQPQNNISICEQTHASSNFNHSQAVSPLIEHTQASAQFVTKEGGKEEHDGLRLWNENYDILQTG